MAFSTNGEKDVFESLSSEDDKSKTIKQELHSVCWACLVEGDLKDMHQTYYYNGKPEVYAELLSYCFSIQVEEDGKQYFFCETCIMRLREASNFRTQIEVTRNAFNSVIDEKPEIYKLVEEDDVNNDDDDIAVEEEWLEDIKPLVKLKLKKEKVKSKTKRTKTKSSKNIKLTKSNDDDCELENNESKVKKLRKLSKKGRRKKLSEDDVIGEIKKEKRDYKKYKEPLPYTLEKTDLECKICGEVFPVHKGLQMHMPIHFPNHICEQCGRWFATRTQLKTHVVSHTTEKEACPICPNRVFKATGGLKAHMRIHAGDKFHYKCKTCNLQFKTFNDRRRHFVSAHGEEEKKYACKHCPKRFSLPTHLSSHVRRDHLQQRPHACDQCSSTFFDRRSLTMHMLKHSGEKNYECNVCHKKYGRKYTLVIHSRTHLGIRPWKCEICSATFTQKCSLKGHMVTHNRDPNKSKQPVVIGKNSI